MTCSYKAIAAKRRRIPSRVRYVYATSPAIRFLSFLVIHFRQLLIVQRCGSLQLASRAIEFEISKFVLLEVDWRCILSVAATASAPMLLSVRERCIRAYLAATTGAAPFAGAEPSAAVAAASLSEGGERETEQQSEHSVICIARIAAVVDASVRLLTLAIVMLFHDRFEFLRLRSELDQTRLMHF